MKQDCPILDSLQETLCSVYQVQKNLSMLRRRLRRCKRCQGKDCQVLAEFNQMVDQALIEVGREWGILE
jgi:hypothetical protein